MARVSIKGTKDRTGMVSVFSHKRREGRWMRHRIEIEGVGFVELNVEEAEHVIAMLRAHLDRHEPDLPDLG